MIGGLIGAAVLTGALALATLGIARLFRPGDASFWHAVSSALAVAGLTTPWLAAALPPIVVELPGWPSIDAFAPAAATQQPLTMAIGLVYVTVTVVLGLRLFAGLQLVRRLARRSEPIEGYWRARLTAVAPEAAAICRTNPRVHVPLVVGWRRPLILLPAAWMQWDDARLGAVLRHELAHLRRGDFGWNLTAALLPVVYWPSPFAWLIARRIRLYAELACDQSAAPAVGAAAYAGVLIQSAREMMSRGRAGRVLAPGAATDLEARIAALLGAGTPARQSSGRVTLTVVLGVSCAMLAALTIRLAAAAPDPDAGFFADHAESHRRAHDRAH